MANDILHLLFFSALIFSCCSKKTFVHGAVEAAYHVLEMKSVTPASTCSASTKALHGMQIVHRYGPCSPLGRDNSYPNSHQILIKDKARVQSINSLASNNNYATNANGEGISLPLFGRDIGAGNYVVKAGFGTPKRDFNLIFDTGSELTWLRCGSDGYQPSASSSSTSPTCITPSCNFTVMYGDKTNASGYYTRDSLTVTPSDVVSNFTFGCGLKISHGFGYADGLLGVGQDGPLSLLSQTYSSTDFAKVFCYCLPRSDSSSGYLLFGLKALQTCQTETSTPLMANPKWPAFYYVKLIGIYIGNQRLDISSNTIMDSGTIITRLPSTVYSALRSEFMKSMSNYSPAPPTELLDTCYDLDGHSNVTIPKMVLRFPEIKVNLDPSAVIWRVMDSQVCLAFAGNDGVVDQLTIIGNHQQRTLNVLYDIQDKKVEFGIGIDGCAN